MLDYLLSRYKRINQQTLLKQPAQYKKKYAIIGTGTHSLTNLYPCIWHLGIPVKYIYSASPENAAAAAGRWKDCTGTGDLNTILNDTSIAGVFLSTRPQLQAGMAKQLLQHNKQVFVEKPVGFSIGELKEVIAAQKNNICQVGLQRRFSSVMEILRKTSKDVTGYNYRFLIGPYPEGNCIYDIFIHPVDFIVQLFGTPSIDHVSVQKDSMGLTCFIVLSHGSVKGMLELSTHYSWQQPLDEITINTKSKTITAKYPDHASALVKPTRLFNIPVEKIMPKPLQKEIYLDSTFVPSASMNSLHLQGFYPQLKHFADTVENNRPAAFSKLESLLPVYDILGKL